MGNTDFEKIYINTVIRFATDGEGGGGGESITVSPLSVTENGSYTAPDGEAYSPVTVSVPQTTASPLSVTKNGTYNAPAGTAYTPVTVDVPGVIPEAVRPLANAGYTFVPYVGMSLTTEELETDYVHVRPPLYYAVEKVEDWPSGTVDVPVCVYGDCSTVAGVPATFAIWGDVTYYDGTTHEDYAVMAFSYPHGLNWTTTDGQASASLKARLAYSPASLADSTGRSVVDLDVSPAPPVTVSPTITANGEYSASDFDASAEYIDTVTVAVSASEPVTGTLYAYDNRTYYPSDYGYDYFDQVDVTVEGGGGEGGTSWPYRPDGDSYTGTDYDNVSVATGFGKYGYVPDMQSLISQWEGDEGHFTEFSTDPVPEWGGSQPSGTTLVTVYGTTMDAWLVSIWGELTSYYEDTEYTEDGQETTVGKVSIGPVHGFSYTKGSDGSGVTTMWNPDLAPMISHSYDLVAGPPGEKATDMMIFTSWTIPSGDKDEEKKEDGTEGDY